MSQRSFTININAVVGSGGTGTSDTFMRTDRCLIVKVKVTESVAGGSYDLEFFQKDTKLVADLSYQATTATGTFFDPKQDLSGVATERNEGPVAIHADDDTTEELHIKITNNDSATKNYTIVVTLEDQDPLFYGLAALDTGLVYKVPVGSDTNPYPYVPASLKVFFRGGIVSTAHITTTQSASGKFEFTSAWQTDVLQGGAVPAGSIISVIGEKL